MLNSTIFGGLSARGALARATLDLKVDTDWCIGRCEDWEKSPEGRARFEELKKKHLARKK